MDQPFLEVFGNVANHSVLRDFIMIIIDWVSCLMECHGFKCNIAVVKSKFPLSYTNLEQLCTVPVRSECSSVGRNYTL